MSDDPNLDHKTKLMKDWQEGYLDGTKADMYPIYTMNANRTVYWEGFNQGYFGHQQAWRRFLKAIS